MNLSMNEYICIYMSVHTHSYIDSQINSRNSKSHYCGKVAKSLVLLIFEDWRVSVFNDLKMFNPS